MQTGSMLPRSLPEGEDENSPGWSPPQRTEPWESAPDVPAPSRRDGRSSTPDIARVVFNAVLFEEGDVLGLEVALLVMLLLARYIRKRRGHLGPSDREGAIALLPFKAIHRAGLVHPMRGCALDLPHGRGDRHGRRQRKQKMNVVLGSSDAERGHLMLARDATHVGPQTRLDFSGDGLASLLGGEDAMKERAAIGV